MDPRPLGRRGFKVGALAYGNRFAHGLTPSPNRRA